MRILMIGGTRFIGRHVVEAARAAGHDVTVFHRGRTGAGLFADVEHADVEHADVEHADVEDADVEHADVEHADVEHRIGDRNSDLSALTSGSWDATVDTCAYVPRQVQALADVLGERAGHYLLVSSVSAYASPGRRGYQEDAPLAKLDNPTAEEVTDETYGGLKVLCERAAVDRFGPRTLIVRPTYVVGPDDYTWRFPWWVARIARGGQVLAPGPADAPSQLIDVRDMARWMVELLDRGESGAFHGVGPSSTFTWGQQLETIVRAVGPEGTSLVWVDEKFLLGRQLGEQELPLWSGGEDDVLVMTADPAAAFVTGLELRPLDDTVRDTLAWTRHSQPPADQGLTAHREAELLARWRDHSTS